MPDTIQFKNGRQIINRYDATGQKLSTMYVTPIYPLSAPLTAGATISTNNSSFRRYGTLYNANMEYTLAYNGNRTLARIHNTEGYALPSNVMFYHRKDHLGSIRSLWSTNYNYDDRYYPSGLPWSNDTGYDVGTYKYNGKEFIETHGYDSYDFHARMRMGAIPAFETPDPLAEIRPWESPYCYAGNNPVNRVDPTGESWRPFDKDRNEIDINDLDNIHGYKWIDYTTDENGNKVAQANTVETAYTFGINGMTTLTSEGYKPQTSWQAYSDISTGNTRADRNIASLDPRVQNQMKAVVLELRLRYGIDVRGGWQGGFRTYTEQDAIFARGASKAKGGESNHNFAIAMDVAIFEGGKYLDKGTEWQYTTYGNIAKQRGLMWGGDWKSFFDPAHIEYKHSLTMKQLRRLPRDTNGFLITLP